MTRLIPLDDGSYDTPGNYPSYQMTHYLTAKNLKYVSLRKSNPRLINQPRQTLFLGGLGRFDFIKGRKSKSFLRFFDLSNSSFTRQIRRSDGFYDKHVGTLTSGKRLPTAVSHEFTIKDKTDLVISGLGWIRVNGEASSRLNFPERRMIVTHKLLFKIYEGNSFLIDWAKYNEPRKVSAVVKA